MSEETVFSDRRKPLSRKTLSPGRALCLGFLVLILAGGLLLTLPAASADGTSLGLLKGMFTATSAVCVTGLSLIEAGRDLSLFGQIVLLCLIQVGGLGFMAFATLGMVLIGRRISLHSRHFVKRVHESERPVRHGAAEPVVFRHGAGNRADGRGAAGLAADSPLRNGPGPVAEPVYGGERLLQRGLRPVRQRRQPAGLPAGARGAVDADRPDSAGRHGLRSDAGAAAPPQESGSAVPAYQAGAGRQRGAAGGRLAGRIPAGGTESGHAGPGGHDPVGQSDRQRFSGRHLPHGGFCRR